MFMRDPKGSLAPFERRLVKAFCGDGPCAAAAMVCRQMRSEGGEAAAEPEDRDETLFEACRQVSPCVLYCPLRQR